MAKLNAAQKDALKKVRKRVQETHWIKGSMARIKDKSGHYALHFWAPRVKGVERDFFVPDGETKEYKTCGCLVGLLRWEVEGVRDIVSGSEKYRDIATIVADHLEQTGRAPRGHDYSTSVDSRESLIINWNDRHSTTRKAVVTMLTEIIGD